MNTKDLNRIGVPHGEAMKRAHAFIVAFTVVAGGDDPGAGLTRPAATCLTANTGRF